MGKMLKGGTFSRSCEGKNFDRKEFWVFISQIERLGDTSDESTGSMPSVNRSPAGPISVTFAKRFLWSFVVRVAGLS